MQRGRQHVDVRLSQIKRYRVVEVWPPHAGVAPLPHLQVVRASARQLIYNAGIQAVVVVIVCQFGTARVVEMEIAVESGTAGLRIYVGDDHVASTPSELVVVLITCRADVGITVGTAVADGRRTRITAIIGLVRVVAVRDRLPVEIVRPAVVALIRLCDVVVWVDAEFQIVPPACVYNQDIVLYAPRTHGRQGVAVPGGHGASVEIEVDVVPGGHVHARVVDHPPVDVCVLVLVQRVDRIRPRDRGRHDGVVPAAGLVGRQIRQVG